MFGYIRVFKPDLTFREFEQYRAVYCSLCETLGHRYGFAARMTLSYDFTFLAMFRLSLQAETPSFSFGHCPYRPFKKRLFCKENCSEALEYATDISVLLTYYKLCDAVQDERFFKRFSAYILRGLVKRDFKKAVSFRPREAAWAEEFMLAQAKVEQDLTSSVDAAAHPTAQFLSRIASADLICENDKEAAERFGYCLGRFIYLADAADDIKDDDKHRRYNVYLLSNPEGVQAGEIQPDFRTYLSESLHNTVAVCAESYEQLPEGRFRSIICNILYRGLPAMIVRICTPKQKESYYEKSL